MADRGLKVFTAVTGGILVILLIMIVGVHIQLNYIIKKTDTIIPSGSLSIETPQLLTPGGQPISAANDHLGVFESLTVSPYDTVNSSAEWRFTASDKTSFSEARYICRLDYGLVYTLYLFGIPVFESRAPGYDHTWTLIDSRAPAGMNGQWNAIRMPETMTMSRDNKSLPTYS